MGRKYDEFRAAVGLADLTRRGVYMSMCPTEGLSIPGLGNAGLSEEEPNFEALAWFWMTLGRGALADADLLGPKALEKSLGMAAGTAAPGLYLVGADGKVAAAYSVELVDEGAGTGEPSKAMETALARMAAAGVADGSTMHSAVKIAPTKFGAQDNRLGDAVNAGFAGPGEAGSLGAHGIASEVKPLRYLGFEPGFASAWTAERAVAQVQEAAEGGLLDAATAMSMKVPLSDLKGLPLINHDGRSFIKNIRNIAPVNNVDPAEGANQPAAREAIVRGLAASWVGASKARLGLADKENHIDPKLMTELGLAEEREKVARSHSKPIGNAKKLGQSVLGTAVRAGKARADGTRRMTVVSKDMALLDGQHSSRNYALVAEALAMEGDGKVNCLQLSRTGRPQFEAVLMCSKKEFKEIFLKEAGFAVPRGRAPAGGHPVPELLAASGMDADEAFADFVAFAKKAQAQVDTVPVPDFEAALRSTAVANSSTPLAIADVAEHGRSELFDKFCRDFNAAAQARWEPERLVTVKDSRADPAWATNGNLTMTVRSVFSALAAASNPAQEMHPSEADLAAATRALAARVPEASEESLEEGARKLAAAGTATLRAKGRGYALNESAVGRLATAWEAMEANAQGKSAFSKLALSAALSHVLKISSIDAATERDKAYALGKTAINLTRALDDGYREMGQKAKGFFDSRATYDNWMLLGLGVGGTNLGSPEACDEIRKAAARLGSALDAGLVAPGTAHNKAREGYVQEVDEIKAKRDAAKARLREMESEAKAFKASLLGMSEKTAQTAAAEWSAKAPERKAEEERLSRVESNPFAALLSLNSSHLAALYESFPKAGPTLAALSMGLESDRAERAERGVGPTKRKRGKAPAA